MMEASSPAEQPALLFQEPGDQEAGAAEALAMPKTRWMRYFLASVLIIMLVEAGIMVLLREPLARLPAEMAAGLDAFLLGSLATPLVWLLVGRRITALSTMVAMQRAAARNWELRATAERERAAALTQLGKTLKQSVAALAHVVETRDPYTAGHQERVTALAEGIARELGLPEERIGCIRLGALLHDIGKVGIPTQILTKPGRLLPQEFELIKLHPGIGSGIVAKIDFDPAVPRIVAEHHERWDGSGYPKGLTGEAIAFEARIVAVADVVEAITSHRPYRAALGLQVAIAELHKQKGKALDPQVVDACLTMLARPDYVFPKNAS